MLMDSSIALIRDIIHSSNMNNYKNKVIHWIKNNGDTWELAFFLTLMQMQEKINYSSEIDKKFHELHEFILKENLAEIFNIKPLIDVK